MIVDFGTSVLLDNSDFSLSLRHHMPSGQRGNRRVVLVDVKLSSPAGVRKNRKASHRHKELNLLMAERQCEPAVIETEVMRWVPEPVT